MRLSLATWLSLSHLLVFCLPVVVLVASGGLAATLREQTREDIEHQAHVVALFAGQSVDSPEASGLNRILGVARERTLAGYKVVDLTGRVIAASSPEAIGEDLSRDGEVVAALAGGLGTAVKERPEERYSLPSRERLAGPSRFARVRMFAAVPILAEAQVIGAVVVSRTPREEVQALYRLAPRVWFGAGLALALTLGMSLAAGWGFSRSLRNMSSASRAIAAGAVRRLDALRQPANSRVREVGDAASAVVTMAERLQLQLAYITEFAGNVSHEFKTPLSTLAGTLELLADDPNMPPEQRMRFLENSLREVDRMDRLVVGLLELARAEEDPGSEVVDVDALLARIASAHDVSLVLGGGSVRGRAEQLETAVSNLVLNALKHGAPPVLLASRVDGDRVEISVQDSGDGISEGNQQRVFDRFFTTDRSSGTGLGLALVAAVARAHLGSVRVESRPGETRFVIDLPV